MRATAENISETITASAIARELLFRQCHQMCQTDSGTDQSLPTSNGDSAN